MQQGTEAWMQRVAAEMNLSETAFVNASALRTTLGACGDALGRVLLRVEAGIVPVFNDVLAALRGAFEFSEDVTLTLGEVVSGKGQNIGSLHVLAVAALLGLSRQATLRLWGEHFSAVVNDPAGTAHANIRTFLKGAEAQFLHPSGAPGAQPVTRVRASGLREVFARGRESALDSQQLADACAACFNVLPAGVDAVATAKGLLMGNGPALPEGAVLSAPALDVAARVKSRALTAAAVHRAVQGDVHAWALRVGLPADAAEFVFGLCDARGAAKALLAAGGRLCESAPTQPGVELGLRWFTPRVEVDLCGHATLAAAKAVFAAHRALDTLAFKTRSGILLATRGRDGGVELEFPAQEAKAEGAASREACAAALGLKESASLEATWFDGTDHVALVRAGEFAAIAPDMTRIRALGGRALAATARGGKHFVSRLFGPNVGIDEDPAVRALWLRPCV